MVLNRADQITGLKAGTKAAYQRQATQQPIRST
jgi:hypothetical protein